MKSLAEKIKAPLRSLTQRYCPQVLERYRSHRRRFYTDRLYRTLQQEALEVLYLHGPPKILTGPFQGMPYLNGTVWGSITPKWVGSYEAELHGIVEEFIARQFRKIVNVGCAEGYYAVGLAWRIPNATVEAFDVDPIARKQTARLARLAGVRRRIKLRINCTAPALNKLVSDRTLLVVDVEGFEVQLLDPQVAPNLARAFLLVEIHPSPPLALAEAADTLRRRFEPSHNLRWFNSEDRTAQVDQYSSLWEGKTSTKRFREYLDEGRRTPQRWLYAEPKVNEIKS